MKWVKILLIITIGIWAAVLTLPDRNLHVVFCNVGQGDAILIYQGQTQALIDGGPPGKRAVECLAEYMPFWDRQIEMVLLTHPDADHSGGLPNVIDRYTVVQFVSVPIGKDSEIYKELVTKIRSAGAKVSNVYAGDKIAIGGAEFEVIWPERSWVESKTDLSTAVSMGNGSAVLGASTATEVNEFSIGGILKYGQFDVVLTGDGDRKVMEDQAVSGRLRTVEVVKVPHHGSKYASSPAWWQAAAPQLAVISVGRNNYGHPADELVKLLAESRVRIMRTDTQGSVELVSNGTNWWVK